jgi:methylenetetrahydrofolate reductase (NADPH)
VPIIPGIMPVTSMTTLEKIVLLSGAKVPPDLVERLTGAAEDKTAVREIGVDFAARLCERLLAEGAPGLHFCTLNGSRATLDIYQRLGLSYRGGGGEPSRSGSAAPMMA